MTSPKKRILLFVHYNWRNELSEHVVYTIRKIRPLFDTIVFISNSSLSPTDHARASELADMLLIRENTGFDFAAWKEGIEALGWGCIQNADSLTLLNDSCFGPLFELEPLYRGMQEKEVDFWGLINHRASWLRLRWSIRRIPCHLQSYFLVFNQAVLRSPAFHSFWRHVSSYKDIWEVIIRLEARLAQRLVRAGFRYVAVLDTTGDRSSHPNWSHYLPDRIIENKLPFIKIKSFSLYISPQALIDRIHESSAYPVELIEDYFRRYGRPDISLLVADTQVPRDPVKHAHTVRRAALHLHLLSVSDLSAIFTDHRQWSDHMDVFISCPDQFSKRELERSLHPLPPELPVKEIRSYAQGDHPWVGFADTFQAYDVVGYLPVGGKEKGTIFSATDSGSFQKPFLPFSTMWLPLFTQCPEIGLLCMDHPAITMRHSSEPRIANDIVFIQVALREIYGKYPAPMKELKAFTIPYASAFWYRPAALEPIRRWLETKPDAERGPLTSKALELLPIYSAWLEGYEYRLIPQHAPKNLSIGHQQAVVDLVECLTLRHLPKTVWNQMKRRVRNMATSRGR